MTIGMSRFILRDWTISFGMRMTSEFPEATTRALLSNPKSPLFLTSASISSIVSWERYSEPHSIQTSASFSPKSIPKNSTSTILLLSLPQHVHLISKRVSEVKGPSPWQERSSLDRVHDKPFHHTPQPNGWISAGQVLSPFAEPSYPSILPPLPLLRRCLATTSALSSALHVCAPS